VDSAIDDHRCAVVQLGSATLAMIVTRDSTALTLIALLASAVCAEQQEPQPLAQGIAAPFKLSDVELKDVQETLKLWRSANATLTSFSAEFTRLEYDSVWHPNSGQPVIISTGVLAYSKPDRGSLEIRSISRWTKDDPGNMTADASGKYVELKYEFGERWVCDGTSLFEFDARQKQLRETVLAEGMRGGKLFDIVPPFLVGDDADKLMQQYWIRIAEVLDAHIRVEAYPRPGVGASYYERVEAILDRKSMRPMAIQLHLPGGVQRHVYSFANETVNDAAEQGVAALFEPQITPPAWSHVRFNEAELTRVERPSTSTPEHPQR
jgi:TIGR03009 family protein